MPVAARRQAASQASQSHASAEHISSNAASLPAVPVVQAAGWTKSRLKRQIRQEGLEGVCNALTAAYLVDVLETDVRDNSTGVDDNMWLVIKQLKLFLDECLTVMAAAEGAESRDISFAFKPYFQEKGTAWLLALPTKNIRTEAGLFQQWMSSDDYEAPEKMVEQNFSGRYADITKNVIGAAVIEALEENFNLGTSFDGIVSFKVFRANGTQVGGHQFAVKHVASPGPDYAGNKFSIFDQNTGIEVHAIRSDDDITRRLTNFIYDYYIADPIAGSVSADFSIVFNY